MRKTACLLLCGLTLLLQACSTTRLGYDHLDTVMRWVLTDYVDLEQPQDRIWQREFPALWDWHRHTQLPLYAADLRQLAGQARQGPLSYEQLHQVSERITTHWHTTIEHILPAFAALNASFGDEQVAELVKNIGAKIDKKGRKRHKYSDHERRERLTDETDSLLRKWLGSVEEPQKKLVAQWVAQTPLIGPRDTADQHQLLDQYAALLQHRHEPGLETGLHALILRPDDPNAPPSRNPAERERRLHLLADISATLNQEQRDHLADKLNGYAEDFEVLAAESAAQAKANADKGDAEAKPQAAPES